MKRKSSMVPFTPRKVRRVEPQQKDKPTAPQTSFDPVRELCVAIPQINEMFNIHKSIGSGSFGQVLLATMKNEHRTPFEERAKFAVKHLSPDSNPKGINREIKCMSKIGGTNNVVKLLCCLKNDASVALIMSYFKCDKYYQYFRLMEPAEVQLYMQNLLVALRHVHKFNVIHRDVKPSNFLYNRDLRKFMLIDFGIAEEVIGSQSKSKFFEFDAETKKVASRAGTSGFQPPEVLLGYLYQTTAVDIWAAGVIFLSILSKVHQPFNPPDDIYALQELACIFGNKQINKVAKKLDCQQPQIERHERLDLRKVCVHIRNLCKRPALNNKSDDVKNYSERRCNCSLNRSTCICLYTKSSSAMFDLSADSFPSSAYDLLSKLLKVNPFKRITAEDALKHPFFKERFDVSEPAHNDLYTPIYGSLVQILGEKDMLN